MPINLEDQTSSLIFGIERYPTKWLSLVMLSFLYQPGFGATRAAGSKVK
jgi:hypothetical protein